MCALHTIGIIAIMCTCTAKHPSAMAMPKKSLSAEKEIVKTRGFASLFPLVNPKDLCVHILYTPLQVYI